MQGEYIVAASDWSAEVDVGRRVSLEINFNSNVGMEWGGQQFGDIFMFALACLTLLQS